MNNVTKKTVTLRCQRDKDIIEVEVNNAYVCKGLAIHRPLNRKRGWTLTHIANNVALRSEFSLRSSSIEEILENIASLMNWEQDFDTIVGQWLFTLVC